MNSLAQRDNESLLSYEGFCIATECGVDENGKIDFATIAARLRQIHRQVITTDMVADWAYQHNWEFRLKLARAELYEKYKPKFEAQAGELKMRRMRVMNDNIMFLIKACNRLKIRIIEEIDELPIKEVIATFDKFDKLLQRYFEAERQESGEEDYRATSVNFNVFIQEFAKEKGWDYEKTEAMRAKLIRNAERLGPGSLKSVSELESATERMFGEPTEIE